MPISHCPDPNRFVLARVTATGRVSYWTGKGDLRSERWHRMFSDKVKLYNSVEEIQKMSPAHLNDIKFYCSPDDSVQILRMKFIQGDRTLLVKPGKVLPTRRPRG